MTVNKVTTATHDALRDQFFKTGWNTVPSGSTSPASGSTKYAKFTASSGHQVVESDGNFRAPQNKDFAAVHADNRGIRDMKLYPVYYSDTHDCASTTGNARDKTTGKCSSVSQCNSGSDKCPGHTLAHYGRTKTTSSWQQDYNNIFMDSSVGSQAFNWGNPSFAPTPMPSACSGSYGDDNNCIATKDWWVGGLFVLFMCFGGFGGFVMYQAKLAFDEEEGGSEGKAGELEMEEA